MPPSSPVTMCARNDRTLCNSASDCKKIFRPSTAGLLLHPPHTSATAIANPHPRFLTARPRPQDRPSNNIRCRPPRGGLDLHTCAVNRNDNKNGNGVYRESGGPERS